ncbi:MAG: lipoyl domain-containing protein [Thermoleophilia bacterium]|nr:lipoyl domain-containing protein [Thermoleophilia bacterium]
MARVAIELPALGFDMETGQLAVWLKQVGDPVVEGEPLAEIETEKATVELESPATGTLVEILAPAGIEVAVGATLGWLES